jgi:hypothetical protein
MSNENHIFISFASQERTLAKELQKLIPLAFDNPVSVFVSDTTITAGEIWEDQIKDNIKKATLIFVLCSPLSIKRPWVNFECGASAINEKVSIIALCHSGLRSDDLINYSKWNQVLDVHSDDFINKVLKAVETHFKIELKRDNYEIKYFKELFSEEYKKESKDKEIKTERPFVKISWVEGNFLKIEPSGDEPEIVQGDLDEEEWRKRIEAMHQFLANPKHEPLTLKAGLAIGIQNCLVDDGNIYVGFRMKSGSDFYSSSMSVAKGSFNTGYQLLQPGGEKNFETMEALQDLFVTMPWHIKQSVRLEDPIYRKLCDRVEAIGGKLFRVLFDKQEGVASIFINHSRRFPRFEIGVWKFIDLSSKEFSKHKEKLYCNGIIDGFGVDVFLDYRGADGVEETPINYWIWVKDGEIFYWSYPEERLIPRKKPGKPPEKPMHAVLVTTKHMAEAYGNTVRYTPFTSDENLRKPDSVLAERFSLPARVLLSCF